MQSNRYDYIIIGSGIAGLICGAWLSSKGRRVLILEKNHQIGGALQVFSREKKIFDTGVHYIGGMHPEGGLNRLFSALGINEKLSFVPLDQACFDRIHFKDDQTTYDLPQGWPQFTEALVHYFPHQKENIESFCHGIQLIVSKFGPYHLKPLSPGAITPELLQQGAWEAITELISDEKLRAVLGGNSLLFAGRRETTPFYMYALILDSYINGPVRMVRGGSQIAKALTPIIHDAGGKVQKYAQVQKINIEAGQVKGVTLTEGSAFFSEQVIAAIHPKAVLELLDQSVIRPGYAERINNLKNTTSFISVYYVLKPDTLPYFNYNIYRHNNKDSPWQVINDLDDARWPDNLMISTGREEINQTYCQTINVLTYASSDDFERWQDTFNTTAHPNNRGESYQAFKQSIIRRISDKLEDFFPHFDAMVESAYCSTPLTYRDFLNTPEGSGYGIEKNYSNIIHTFVSPKMKIGGLWLTGQNTDLHGVYGAAISALLTLSHTSEGQNIFDEIIGH